MEGSDFNEDDFFFRYIDDLFEKQSYNPNNDNQRNKSINKRREKTQTEIML